MDVARRLALLRTNEQSIRTETSSSPRLDRPASYAPRSPSLNDEGLGTLVEEEEGDDGEMQLAKRSTSMFDTRVSNTDSRPSVPQRKHQRAHSTTHVQPSRFPRLLSWPGTGATFALPRSSTRIPTPPLASSEDDGALHMPCLPVVERSGTSGSMEQGDATTWLALDVDPQTEEVGVGNEHDERGPQGSSGAPSEKPKDPSTCPLRPLRLGSESFLPWSRLGTSGPKGFKRSSIRSVDSTSEAGPTIVPPSAAPIAPSPSADPPKSTQSSYDQSCLRTRCTRCYAQPAS